MRRTVQIGMLTALVVSALAIAQSTGPGGSSGGSSGSSGGGTVVDWDGGAMTYERTLDRAEGLMMPDCRDGSARQMYSPNSPTGGDYEWTPTAAGAGNSGYCHIWGGCGSGSNCRWGTVYRIPLEQKPSFTAAFARHSNWNGNARAWIGVNTAGSGGATVMGSDTPSATSAAKYIAFRWSAGTDTNWQCCYGDGTSDFCSDTGIAPVNDASTATTFTVRPSGANYIFLINGTQVCSLASGTYPTTGVARAGMTWMTKTGTEIHIYNAGQSYGWARP